MGYQLGVDLGTTYTAAAIARDGHVEPVTLGSASPVIPSVVLVRADGEVLVGEAAVRRGAAEPTRLAREFKRRLGDPTPLVLGGTPFGAEALMGYVLKAVIGTVTAREGAGPERVVLTHPANYGPYKLDMLREVARQAGLDLDRVSFLTEPQAAAISYATRARVDLGEVVGVYDFGGGTLDVALVQRTDDGFELLGRPEGMERFGGIDIDAALLAVVDDRLEGRLSALNGDDPAVQTAMLRLRDDCRAAKEALSSDTETTVQVHAPGLSESVVISRADLEDMVRPRLRETIDALGRATTSAGLGMERIGRVLLVGGSSQIPLVADAVRTATGRPVAIDAHPKFAICLGAAAFAGGIAAPGAFGRASATTAPPPTGPGAGAPPTAGPSAGQPAGPTIGDSAGAPPPTYTPAPPGSPGSPGSAERLGASANVPPPPTSRSSASAPPSSPSTAPAETRNKLPLLIGAVVVAVGALIGAIVAFGGDDGGSTQPTLPSFVVATLPDVTTPPSVTTPQSVETTPPSVQRNQVTPADRDRAFLTTDDLSPGWTSTVLDDSRDICGQLLSIPAVDRRAVGFSRNDNTPEAQQLSHVIEIYATPADAKAVLAEQRDVITNSCNGFVNSTPQGDFDTTAAAIPVPASVDNGLPDGCGDVNLANLIFTSRTDQSVISLQYAVVRCGNVLSGLTMLSLGPDGADAAGTELISVAFPRAAEKAGELPFTR